MSLDLFQREAEEHVGRLTPATSPEVGAFDGFVRGTAMLTMRGLVKTGSAIDLMASVVPIAYDAITGGTEAQDKFFKWHNDVFGKAVDYWTPQSHEVGVAGQVAGSLLSMLPQVLISPSLAVGSAQMGTSEELVKQGVDPTTANAVGATQGAGLGLGIYVPILGKTLTQRMLLGGAGFNVAQGVATRGVSDALLEGTPAADQFAAFDTTQLTLDVLLGAAFGGIAHLSPAARAQGAEFWDRLEALGKGMKPSEVDALMVLRQAQHLNADSMPGKPTDPIDVERHVQRTRRAIEQLARDEPVEVSDLPQPKFEADDKRLREMERNVKALAKIADDIRQEEGLPVVPESEAPAAKRGDTEPPPRGQRGAEAAGAEVIPRASLLSDADRTIETRFAEDIAADVDEAIRRYSALPESHGGKVINTDLARELSPDYVKDRTRSTAVHEPASWLMKEVYRRKLAEPDPTGMDTVLFTAGGTGAGKTTAISNVPQAELATRMAHIVYDTNLNSFKSAVEKIDQALKANKNVRIVTVVRDPVESLTEGALPRAERMGRTVPLSEHARTHIGVVETIPKLMEKYKSDKRVKFAFVDNTLGKGNARLGTVKLLARIDSAKLESRLRSALDDAYRQGKISESVYRGTLGDVAHGPDQGPPGDVGRRPRSDNDRGDGGIAQRTDGTRDPLALEVERFANENPDLLLRVGQNADGTPIVKSLQEYLAEVRHVADDARQDASLFSIAAQCLFGRAA